MCEVSWQRAGKEITKRGPKDSQKRTKEKSKSYALAEMAKTTTRVEYNQKEKEPRRWATQKKKEKKGVLTAITN
jgi:hypothetical protein